MNFDRLAYLELLLGAAEQETLGQAACRIHNHPFRYLRYNRKQRLAAASLYTSLTLYVPNDVAVEIAYEEIT